MKKLIYIVVCLIAIGFSLESFTQEPNKTKEPVKKKTNIVNPKSIEPFAEFAFDDDTNINSSYVVFDFGKITQGPDVMHQFKFKNIGNSPLIISDAKSSCCLVPQWSKDPIAPNAKSEIKLIYHTQGRPGIFSKIVSVTSNSKSRPYIFLNVKGIVSE